MTDAMMMLAWAFGGLAVMWGRSWSLNNPAHVVALLAAGPFAWAALVVFAWKWRRTR